MGSLEKGSSWGARLRHAFALDRTDTVDPDLSELEIVERVCAEIVRRRLTTVALLILEMHRPFHYVSAQLLHFFEPVVSIVADTAGYRAFACFLEQRGAVDHLVGRLEALEAGREGVLRDQAGRPRDHD